MMLAALTRLRAAALPVFLSHALTTSVAAALAFAFYRASPNAFATGQPPVDARYIAELARAMRDMLGAFSHLWPLILGALLARVVLALLEQAFWLQAMVGRSPGTALRAALRNQPTILQLALAVGLAQVAWAAAVWFGGQELAGIVESNVGIVLGDLMRAALLALWLLGAHLIGAGRDSAFARVVCGGQRPMRALRTATSGLAHAALVKAGCSGLASLAVAMGGAASLVAWPDHAPLVLLAFQQLCAALAVLVRAGWVAFTAEHALQHQARVRHTL